MLRLIFGQPPLPASKTGLVRGGSGRSCACCSMLRVRPLCFSTGPSPRGARPFVHHWVLVFPLSRVHRWTSSLHPPRFINRKSTERLPKAARISPHTKAPTWFALAPTAHRRPRPVARGAPIWAWLRSGSPLPPPLQDPKARGVSSSNSDPPPPLKFFPDSIAYMHCFRIC
jgi:hypothetical protein